MRLTCVSVLCLCAFLNAARVWPAEPKMAMTATVEELVAKAKPAVVVVSIDDRNSQQLGLGSGFVIASDGLIATNLHVIGEARPISVQFSDGKKFDVTTVHATDKALDLAILKIEARNLPTLELGDSDTLQQGQQVIALGNPLGLRHSVVAGIVSEKREVEGRPMIQLAMPIEKGNSGGPLLDMQGRVHGLITLKSLIKDDVGFAVAVNQLKPLLEKPNPIPMAQWQTIGSIDSTQWTPVGGARWRQRAGRILVEEAGRGFGGRSLCLSTTPVPEVPFEIAVQVKFSPESGAAGLVFHSDGGDKHYGFYPSSGKLRVSRFNGADVYSWKVLEELPHAAYRPGDWNHLKVRVEAEKFQCFINGQLAVESTDRGFTKGAVGLAKFRDTKAEFRGFQVGANLSLTEPKPETVKQIREFAAEVTPDMNGSGELIGKLSQFDRDATDVLRREAKALEQRAERLKQLAVAVHARKVQQELALLVAKDAAEFDLLRASLLIAKLDNEELDVDAYQNTVQRMADEIRRKLKAEATESEKLQALNDYLFQQRGFHGSRTNYYHRSNSYLNEVIDDREGLPITLSILHLELAKKLEIKVVGVPLPGKFVVRFEPKSGDTQLIDVFEGGRVMTAEQAVELIKESLDPSTVGAADSPEFKRAIDGALAPASSKAIAMRMLSNLRNVAENDNDSAAIRRYLDTMLVFDPESVETRARRIDLSIRENSLRQALIDIDWMLEKRPAGMDVGRVQRLRSQLEAELKGMM